MAITATANQPTVGGVSYQSALNRWMQQQKQSSQQFQNAADPLQQAVGMFQPGGGFGAGRIADLEAGARQSRARATADQVASGMSSGSLATSTGLRIDSDLARAKLGVEDTRTQFLNQALQSLSGLRGQQASQTGAATDPFFNTALSTQAAAESSAASRGIEMKRLDEAKRQADRNYDLQVWQANEEARRVRAGESAARARASAEAAARKRANDLEDQDRAAAAKAARTKTVATATSGGGPQY